MLATAALTRCESVGGCVAVVILVRRLGNVLRRCDCSALLLLWASTRFRRMIDTNATLRDWLRSKFRLLLRRLQ